MRDRSLAQPVQLLDVDALEGLLDAIDDDLHDQETHQGIEEDAHFHDERDAVGAEHGQERDAVLERQEADHLGQRLLAADDDKQAHEDEAHGERHARARGQPAHVEDGPGHDVGQHHEEPADHERGGGVDIGLQLARAAETPVHALEENRHQDALEPEEDHRHHPELAATRDDGDEPGRRGQSHRLSRESADVRGRAAAPQEREPAEQHQARYEHREMAEGGIHRYRTRKDTVMARTASTNDTASSSGTRKSLSLATRVSKTASATARTTSLASRVARAQPSAAQVSTVATPQGTKRLPRSEKKRSTLSQAAHSISAR